MRRVTSEHRRRILVDRQLLGADGRAARTIDDVVSALALLHSTDPSTPYLSLQARSEASIDDVDAAFYEQRSLLRFTTIRRTVFAMDHAAARAAHGAFNVALAQQLRTQLVKWLDASDEVDGSSAEFLRDVESAVVESLRSEGPATGGQLAERVPGLRVRFDPRPGVASSKPIRITSKVLEVLGVELAIGRGRPTGADLTSGAWTWAVYGDVDTGNAPQLDQAEALAALLGRYLAAFGPATVTDMTWWTGLTKTKVRAALAALGAVEVELEDAPEPGFVSSDDDLTIGTHAGPSVALLPGLDPTTMGWKQRAWYVDDRVATGLFDRNGNAGPTVWVDGRVVGAWTQRGDGEIVVELLDELEANAAELIAAEASRISSWLGDVRVNWRYPTPLTRGLER